MDKSIKHIFIVSLLFLLMLGVVSSASATTEQNYANATAFLNNISNLQDNSIITISSSEADVSQVYEINASNITIKPVNGPVTFNSAVIDSSFIINGNHITVQGITFNNFLNSYTYAPHSHGAIWWKGDNGTVYDCNFINNSADCGSSIVWDGANGIVHDCNFINNTGDWGASIDWKGDNGTVYNCNFINNDAGDNDGVGSIYWNGDNGKVTNCTFTNSIGFLGGAINWGGDSGNIINCTFSNSIANNDGGAVYWFGKNGNIENCNFSNCVSKYFSGAVYWFGKNGNIENCNFDNCTSQVDCAAVFWGGDCGKLANCTFINGGAYEGECKVTNCTEINCTSIDVNAS